MYIKNYRAKLRLTGAVRGRIKNRGKNTVKSKGQPPAPLRAYFRKKRLI
jgi:hypothetical protein